MKDPDAKPVSDSPDGAEREFEVSRVRRSGREAARDFVAAEEPMEIRVVFGPVERRTMRNVSITMRTPGHEDELAVGFLFTEGLLSSHEEIEKIETRGVDNEGRPTGNIVRVHLRPEVPFDPVRLQRNFLTTSSCGVCGKASLDALEVQGLTRLDDESVPVTERVVHSLPDLLRAGQATFARTGGLHGSGLFDAAGRITCIREDVGRHNAVDKLIGRQFLDGRTPLDRFGMIVSGRVSFEIMQKALVARLPVLVAVGAPSSLAIETALRYNMTLIGFTSAERFNVYSCGSRVVS